MEDADGPDAASDSDAEEEVEEKPLPPPKKSKDRKRKREEADDLESRYLNKLADEEVKEGEKMKKQKKEQKKEQKLKEAEAKKQEDDDTSSEEEEDAEDKSDDDNAAEVGGDDEDTPEEDEDASSDEIPVHESILAAKSKEAPAKDDEVEKANRTVFLSNVAAEATTSKTAKKTLMDHLSTVLADDEKIESIRFRSLAFSTGALPKRAAYITQSIMESTTKSANAYVVYSSPSGARKAFAELNGTVVLDRHLRVDSVAHPSPVDHRRCVFVGNLGFVDDETVINTNSAGETSTRKRTKIPSDTEEGLWQTFGKHAGKVENVRVVRDPKTRVGKGFAYVQFYVSTPFYPALTTRPHAYQSLHQCHDTQLMPPRTKTMSRPRSSSTARNTPPCSRASSASSAPRPRTRRPWPRSSARPRPPPWPASRTRPRRAQSTSTRRRRSSSRPPGARRSSSAARAGSARC